MGKNLKAERFRHNRQVLKEIERFLHPTLSINNIEIVHRHHGQYIYFNPYINGSVVLNAELRFHRDYVYAHRHGFYQTFADNFERLISM